MTRSAQRTIAVVLAVIFALAVVEGLLRHLSPHRLIIKDATRGWALRPGARAWTYFESSGVWARVNSDGLADREHRLERTNGTRRVALLGDSYLTMFNLPYGRTFVPQLEAVLNRCGGQTPVEAINFGVWGYGTGQELLTYRLHTRRYRPDVVVLAFFLGNDLINNYRPVEPTGVAPTYEIADGALRYVATPAQEIEPDLTGLPLYHRARLFVTRRLISATVLYDAWAALRNGPRAVEQWDREDSRQDLVYRPPTEPADIEAWRVTEKLIDTLASDVAADGAEFWLLLLPTPAQVHPDLSVRRQTSRRFGVASLSYANVRLGALAQARHWNTMSLVEPLAEYAERTGVFLHGGMIPEVMAGTGHWNEAGNRIAADIFARHLCAESPALN